MDHRVLPPLAYLRECFDYDPQTGYLSWRTRPTDHFHDQISERKTNTRCAGKRAGTVTKGGYHQIKVWGAFYRATRIIWMLMTNKDPGGDEIDHRDGCTTNDAWNNLRNATHQQNMHNYRPRKRTHLPKGVTFRKDRNTYFARIKIGGKTKYLGTFQTAQGAAEAHNKAAEKFHGQFWTAGDHGGITP